MIIDSLNVGNIVTSSIGKFEVIKNLGCFDGFIENRSSLLFVYDNNDNLEKYIKYVDYKKLDYDIKKNINIITYGYFIENIKQKESFDRYDIINVESGEIMSGVYLHNGEWSIENIKIDAE